MSGFVKEFTKGIIISNPVFILALGLCPTLAMSNKLENALGMSAAVLFVLLCSNIVVSAIRKYVPNIMRIPVFIIVIATFVTIVNLVFQAYLPSLHESLGIYLPLVVVNCIILGRAEAFASKNPITASIADALGIGIGFALAITIIALIRETLGTGSLTLGDNTLFTLPVLGEHPITILSLSAGAFLVIGLLLAFFRRIGVAKNE